MITIERLEEVENVCQRIKAIQTELKHVYNTYRSPSFSSNRQVNDPADPVSKAFYRAERLSDELDRLLAIRMKFEEELMNVDCEIQAIIRCRYILGYNWKETSQRLYHTQSYFQARDKLRWYISPSQKQKKTSSAISVG